MESILKMTDLQLVRRYNMKIIAFWVCHMPSLHNALVLKAAPQASVMAGQHGTHVAVWQGYPRSWSQDRQEDSLRGWAHGTPLLQGVLRTTPCTKESMHRLPFCSMSESGMETIRKVPKKNQLREKKGPCDSNQRLFQEVSSLLA